MIKAYVVVICSSVSCGFVEMLLQAQPGDYLSRVAGLAGIRLEKFMLDNTDVVKDLDAALQGSQLLLCDPTPGE
jgi:hypothetical protein